MLGRALAALALSVALLLAGAPSALAQEGLSKEGALFLLVPIGARAVGMGQAVVASNIGSEGFWWNPASVARLTMPEFSINASKSVIADGYAVTLVRPTGVLGVLSVGAYIYDYGEQIATDFSTGEVGRLNPRSIVLATSYAAAFGSRVSLGLTYKFVQQRLDCSGQCGNIATFNASTSAVDIGMQAVIDRAKNLTVGVTLRNFGPRLQVNDNPQADPLPSRVVVGAQYVIPNFAKQVPDGDLRLMAELVDRASLDQPSLRLGGEFGYRKQIYLRGGYITGSGDASGASVGLGIKRGGVAMDFARGFGDTSTDSGNPPTFLTLRFLF